MTAGSTLSRTERVWMARLAQGPRVQRKMGDDAVNRLIRRGLVTRAFAQGFGFVLRKVT